MSVIVVSYRTRELTGECLRTLAAAADGVAVEVIVVDNASGDGTDAMVRDDFPSAQLLLPAENLGFARAVNLAAGHARGAMLLLVNPDAVLDPGSVRALLDVAEANPDGGLYGGALIAGDGAVAPESYPARLGLWNLTCFAFGLSVLFRTNSVLDAGFLPPPPPGGVRRVGYVTGAFLLTSRRLWGQLGGFDERFRMYGEDLDLGLRAMRLGCRPLVTSAVTARHRSGASTSSPAVRAEMILAGKAALIRKHWRPPARSAGLALLSVGVWARAAVSRLAGGARRRGTWPQVWEVRSRWQQGYPSTSGRGPSLRVMGWPAYYGQWANPYTALLSAAVQASGEVSVEDLSRKRLLLFPPDILHVHWPEWPLRGARPVRAAATTIALLAVARLRGTKVVWTTHDLVPHECLDTPVARLYWWSFLHLVDGTVSLSTPVRQELERRYPALSERPHLIVPHGHYRGAYPDAPTRAKARAALGLAAASSVILFFGQLRAYKDLPSLLDAFREVADEDAVLVVAGDSRDEAVVAELRRRAAADPRVRLDVRRVPDRDVPALFAAADAVALPYARIWSSGAALLALSFDRPVLLPDTDAFRELRDHVSERWVRLFTPPLAAGDLEGLVRRRPRPPAPLGAFEWSGIANRTTAHYEAVRDAG